MESNLAWGDKWVFEECLSVDEGMDWLEQRKQRWQAFVKAMEKFSAEVFPSTCLKQCQHHCCNLKETKLLAPKEEIAVLLGHEPEDWSVYASDDPNLYRFSGGDCPHYDRQSRQCKIWDDPRRPPICREFPFGMYHDKLFSSRKLYVSPACAFDSSFQAWSQLDLLCNQYGVELVRLQASV